MNLKMKRDYFPNRTEGRVFDEDGNFVVFTMELPWLSNLPFKSCVPPGIYDLVYHNSPKYGRSWHLVNCNLGVSIGDDTVRTHCLFHAANRASELLGCIAPGLRLGRLSGEAAVLNSRDAIKTMNKLLDCGVSHTLEIMV